MTPIQYHQGGFPPPRDAIDWHAVLPHLGPATSAVARYDSLLHAIPNSRVLLSPLSTQEAVLSSRIEGMRATMNEVLEFEANGGAQSPELSADIREILNYRRAMIEAEQMLETLPVSLRVIRRAHGVLLDGVRGAGKAPGEFRRVPNWIGPPGCAVEEARFVPPPAQERPCAGIGTPVAVARLPRPSEHCGGKADLLTRTSGARRPARAHPIGARKDLSVTLWPKVSGKSLCRTLVSEGAPPGPEGDECSPDRRLTAPRFAPILFDWKPAESRHNPVNH